MITYLLAGFALWALVNLIIPELQTPDYPFCTCFRIHIPLWCVTTLTRDEFMAVATHEISHRRRFHPWINFLCLCFFLPMEGRVMRQEMEADADTEMCGLGPALATARVKIARRMGYA